MSDYFLSEIRIFAGNYVPNDWGRCDGSLLAISSNEALFSLIGTLYGGDGTTSFALPDMKGRIPIHKGTGLGLTPRSIATSVGTETVTITTATMPAHTHTLRVLNSPANTNVPTNNMLGVMASPYTLYDDLNSGSSAVDMYAGSILSTGGSQSHDNIMPSLALTFMICVQNGIYPTRS